MEREMDLGSLLSIGLGRLKNQRYLDAQGFFERVLAVDPNNINALCGLGLCLLDGGPAWGDGPARAISVFQKALELGPENPTPVIYNLANAYKKSGKFEEGLGVLIAHLKGELSQENILLPTTVSPEINDLLDSLNLG